MKTSSKTISVNELEVQVIRKDIRNMHLSVHPPEGRVRISAPMHATDDKVRLVVTTKLNWIKKQQARFEGQPRQSKQEMVTGENHYLFGRGYLLEVIERSGRHQVNINNNSTLVLYVNPGTTKRNRELVINEWYREQLKRRIPELIEKWQPVIGKEVREWGVKKMKTRWGSCNINRRRIWLNLELVKKSPECLEYVLVHEMVHLLERYHNDNFKALMTGFLPNWKLTRNLLNRTPLVHEDWGY